MLSGLSSLSLCLSSLSLVVLSSSLQDLSHGLQQVEAANLHKVGSHHRKKASFSQKLIKFFPQATLTQVGHAIFIVGPATVAKWIDNLT